MTQNNLKLLDCTLRDGGYINDWNWGFQTARSIIQSLVRAKIDIIEAGFLRSTDTCTPDRTVCNTIEELNHLLPDNTGQTIFSAMAMRSNYDISKLSPYSGTGIEMIRITAHDYDIAEGMEFAKAVKARGYKLSINPINIMGYSDREILWIVEQVNKIQPYQFSIVDTFGSMKRKDLLRIASVVHHNLDPAIRLALHLHENMSLSYSLAQDFIEQHLNRPVTIDASLMGIGRTPGNLPVELIADYLNDNEGKAYEIDCLMDAIGDYISPMRGETQWGYSPSYFLSARFNLHRNYAEHYLKKGDLTNRDINHILARFDREKCTAFDPDYADRLYEEYKNNVIDDSQSRSELKQELQGRDILLLAPGATINTHEREITQYIALHSPIVISVNFIPGQYHIDYSFFGNSKRFDYITSFPGKVIAASNLSGQEIDYRIDYNSLTGDFSYGCNSLLMVLKLLRDMGVKSIALAGADGYREGMRNYYDGSIRNYVEHGSSFNEAVVRAVNNLGISIEFVTPSIYSEIMRA